MFGPDSITWKIDREMALFLGGPRAILLQIAHPAVAAAVERHSSFRTDPLGRLSRTLDSVFKIVFGDASEAKAAADRVARRHAPVRGTIEEKSASPWSGRTYHAQDPELMLWVHATLVDTALFVFRAVVRDLSPTEAAAYYEESKAVGELIGIPRSVLPATLADFDAYFAGIIGGPTLHVGAVARTQCDDLTRLEPSYALRSIYGDERVKRWSRFVDVRPIHRGYGSFTRVLAAGMLPPRLRAAYGYEWRRRDRLAYQGVLASAKVAVRVLPPRLRFLPGYEARARSFG